MNASRNEKKRGTGSCGGHVVARVEHDQQARCPSTSAANIQAKPSRPQRKNSRPCGRHPFDRVPDDDAIADQRIERPQDQQAGESDRTSQPCFCIAGICRKDPCENAFPAKGRPIAAMRRLLDVIAACGPRAGRRRTVGYCVNPALERHHSRLATDRRTGEAALPLVGCRRNARKHRRLRRTEGDKLGCRSIRFAFKTHPAKLEDSLPQAQLVISARNRVRQLRQGQISIHLVSPCRFIARRVNIAAPSLTPVAG